MSKSLSFTALLLFGTIIACDITISADPDPVSITRIREVIATPDTVTYGDTVRVHCVLEDSSRPDRWVYTWTSFDDEFIIPIEGSNRKDTAIVLWDTSQIDTTRLGRGDNFSVFVSVDDPSIDQEGILAASGSTTIHFLTK